jgi:hypothetical protein
VRDVDQLDTSHLRVVVDDASTALPDVVEAVGASGAEVRSASETRPSFDTVFATLVERQRAAEPGDGADETSEAVA